ncbi:hypothetical protein H4Q26_007140 [Puccinia striiformis f. sp. tritici PST-130]|nr:hypothetical protein H4Q26_007140 [Puccinia striiformis f. sp. tritici PST-130]
MDNKLVTKIKISQDIKFDHPDPYTIHTKHGGKGNQKKIQLPNPWRKKADGRVLRNVPITLYADDTSENISKKFNKHISFYFTLSGLSPNLSNQEYNCYFLLTSNRATGFEIASQIVAEMNNITREGFIAFDPTSMKEVLVTGMVLCFLGDTNTPNPGSSLNPCRMCHLKTARMDDKKSLDYIQQFSRINSDESKLAGNESNWGKVIEEEQLPVPQQLIDHCSSQNIKQVCQVQITKHVILENGCFVSIQSHGSRRRIGSVQSLWEYHSRTRSKFYIHFNEFNELYSMREVSRTQTEQYVNVNEIEACINVQHNCDKGDCPIKKTKPSLIERQETGIMTAQVEHFVINTAKPAPAPPNCTRSSPEHPVYSIIRTGFPAGPRVRFRPEPSPRPNPHPARLLTRGRPPTLHRSPTREQVLPLISTGDWRSICRIHPPPDSKLTRSLPPSQKSSRPINRRSTKRILTPTHRKQSLHMTPVENQDLIQHYLTLVKQQRADNPPPPPFVDPLTSDKRLDRIIKNVLANQEAELDHKIFLNQSLREYRKAKKMEAMARRDAVYQFMVHLTSELIKDPRPTLHSKDFNATYFKKKFEALEKNLTNDKLNPLYLPNLATFNIRFEDYKDTLVKAQEIEVQATQTRDKTIVPTTKHLAKMSITDKTANKKEKATRKKILPLESTLDDNSISSFTTEPYFEDLEPTTSLPSPFLKKITLKKELPIITDSEGEEEKEPTNRSSSPVLEKIARKKTLSILSDSEDKIDEDQAIPTLNPSTLTPKSEPNKRDKPMKFPKPWKGTIKPPKSLGIIRKPRSSNVSQTSNETESESESESEDEIQEAEVIKILIKKHAIVDEDMKRILDQAQQSQLILQKLIPNKEIESYVSGWNPWIEKKKVFPAPPKNKKRPKSNKRHQPCQSGSNRPDQSHLNNRSQARSNNSRNQARSDARVNQDRSNNNQRQGHSNNWSSNKRPRKESKDLEDAVRWAKVHRATAVLGAFFRHTKR